MNHLNYIFSCVYIYLYFFQQNLNLNKIDFSMMNNNQIIEQHIYKRYDVGKKIGSGAYGNVWKVTDKKSKKIYALKKIFDAFQHSTDAQRTYRQIMFLKLFDHPNIIKLQQVYKAENDKDIYLIFQYMEADLHHVIRQNILQQIHKQYIIYQIAISLRYLHSGQVIHRDLKPSNILLDSECFVKLCDFGLIRSVAKVDKHCPILTQYVATRWYRAPQILLGSNDYTKQVDMWSLGCIIGEFLVGKPMFPGQSTLNQLQLILSFTGKPNAEDIDSLKSDLAKSMIDEIQSIKIKPIKEWFPFAPLLAIDLVYKLLQINPKKRLTCDELLKHPYINSFNGKGNQSISKIPFQIKNDDQKLTMKEYRNLIYESLKQKTEKISLANYDPYSNKKSHNEMNNSLKNKINNKIKTEPSTSSNSNLKKKSESQKSLKNNIKAENIIVGTSNSPNQNPSMSNKSLNNQKGIQKVQSTKILSKPLSANSKNIIEKKIQYMQLVEKEKEKKISVNNNIKKIPSTKVQKNTEVVKPFTRISSAIHITNPPAKQIPITTTTITTNNPIELPKSKYQMMFQAKNHNSITTTKKLNQNYLKK